MHLFENNPDMFQNIPSRHLQDTVQQSQHSATATEVEEMYIVGEIIYWIR